jgi:hypothetical protein
LTAERDVAKCFFTSILLHGTTEKIGSIQINRWEELEVKNRKDSDERAVATCANLKGVKTFSASPIVDNLHSLFNVFSSLKPQHHPIENCNWIDGYYYYYYYSFFFSLSLSFSFVFCPFAVQSTSQVECVIVVHRWTRPTQL